MRRIPLAALLALAIAALAALPAAPASPSLDLLGGAADGDKGCDHGPHDRGRTLTYRVDDTNKRVSLLNSVGTGGCPGVRPGMLLQIPVNDEMRYCTANFLIRGVDAAGGTHAYLGTAGHCILGESMFSADSGERTWPLGQGPEVQGPDGQRIGEFAYAVELSSERLDFALVRLDAGVPAQPDMCHFGGPTGVNAETSTSLSRLHFYGNGNAVGSVAPARTVAATSMTSSDHVQALGLTAPGDSGAGVIDRSGRAVGVVVTLGPQAYVRVPHPEPGLVGITRIAPQLHRAGSVLGQRLEIRTAPLR